MNQFRIRIPEYDIDIKIVAHKQQNAIAMFSYGKLPYKGGMIFREPIDGIEIASISYPDIKYRGTTLRIFLEGSQWRNYINAPDNLILFKVFPSIEFRAILKTLKKSKFNIHINPLITVL